MKRPWVTVAALMLMIGLVSLAEAARGEVCYSSAAEMTTPNPLANTTTFTCPTLGASTIPQIYQKGWRIVHLSLESMVNHEAMIQGGDPFSGSHTMWMILIEGP